MSRLPTKIRRRIDAYGEATAAEAFAGAQTPEYRTIIRQRAVDAREALDAAILDALPSPKVKNLTLNDQPLTPSQETVLRMLLREEALIGRHGEKKRAVSILQKIGEDI